MSEYKPNFEEEYYFLKMDNHYLFNKKIFKELNEDLKRFYSTKKALNERRLSLFKNLSEDSGLSGMYDCENCDAECCHPPNELLLFEVERIMKLAKKLGFEKPSDVFQVDYRPAGMRYHNPYSFVLKTKKVKPEIF